MKDRFQKLLGYLVGVVALLGGAAYCVYYFTQKTERVHGAVALGIAEVLLIALGFWVAKDLLPKKST